MYSMLLKFSYYRSLNAQKRENVSILGSFNVVQAQGALDGMNFEIFGLGQHFYFENVLYFGQNLLSQDCKYLNRENIASFQKGSTLLGATGAYVGKHFEIVEFRQNSNFENLLYFGPNLL